MAAPPVLRRLRRIIIRIVVHRHVDRCAIGDVTVVFVLERVAVILEVVEHIKRSVLRVFDKAGPRLRAVDQDWQTRVDDIVAISLLGSDWTSKEKRHCQRIWPVSQAPQSLSVRVVLRLRVVVFGLAATFAFGAALALPVRLVLVRLFAFAFALGRA